MRTIDEIKRANKDRGLSWFSAGNMRFFSCRVSNRVHPLADGGALFVTSEADRWSGYARRYSVRHCDANGEIDTVGEFQEHATLATAHAAARDAAANWKYS